MTSPVASKCDTNLPVVRKLIRNLPLVGIKADPKNVWWFSRKHYLPYIFTKKLAYQFERVL